MSDWINPDNFIIVTGLQNNLYSFSYDLQYANNELFYESLKADYNISFEQKLVQINLPLVLSKDYLSTVALYHELGHFVDTQYAITLSCAQIIHSSPLKGPLRNSLEPYFPYINKNYVDLYQLYYHLGEYFCDLFAAQYVGSTLSYYLEYITNQQNSFSQTHPSTVNRSKVISDYICKIDNPVLNILNSGTKKLLDMKIEKRYDDIVTDDFYNLIPYDIKNNKELHGVIVYGWNVWLSDFNKFNTVMKYDVHLSDITVYKAINSLVEKSIGNYFITNSWQKCKNE